MTRPPHTIGGTPGSRLARHGGASVTHTITGYTAGQARSGRWWVTCPRPDCEWYRAGLPRHLAHQLGDMHDHGHRQKKED